jgi:hypothetical protein
VEDKFIEKERFDGEKVEILGETYEPGMPDEKIEWRGKLRSREEMINYLKTGERYWYSDEWYGSERRKNPA